MLSQVAQSRAKAGFTQSETARLVFSLKQALFPLLQREFQSDPQSLTEETWAASALIDELGLQKPFRAGRLIQKILEVLHTPNIAALRGS